MEDITIVEENAETEQEPRLDSSDPEERKKARQLRIEKRKEALKRHQEISVLEVVVVEEKTLKQKQEDLSTAKLDKLLLDGKEHVTNVRVASDAQEVQRRENELKKEEIRNQKLENDATESEEKFKTISEKWDRLLEIKDPLDLHGEIQNQKAKCDDFIEQKNMLINELRKELDLVDDRYNKNLRKQTDELDLLAERIDQQVILMKKAYLQELELIEQAIEKERATLVQNNRSSWNALYKQRDEEEKALVQRRLDTVDELQGVIAQMYVDDGEKMRESKIKMVTDVQVLQQELQQIKAVCLFNSEKLDYNYQILKKRDEENTVMKSQHKREINKMQDQYTALKNKIAETEKKTADEIKRLTDEVMDYHRNILESQRSSDLIAFKNEKRFRDLWRLNREDAMDLLKQILEIDRVIHEQQLGLDWKEPDLTVLEKRDWCSRSAMDLVAEIFNEGAITLNPLEEIVPEQGCQPTLQASPQGEDAATERRLLRQILQAVSDHTGFLVEDLVHTFLKSGRRRQGTMIKLDHVFSALGLQSRRHMMLLKKYFMPYAQCPTCSAKTSYKGVPVAKEEDKPEPQAESASGTTKQSEGTREMHSSILKDIGGIQFGVDSREQKEEEKVSDKEESQPSICNNHVLYIDSIYAFKGLKHLTTKLRAQNYGSSSWDDEKRRRSSKLSNLSGEIGMSDIQDYWGRFLQIFTPEKEKLWDGLVLGLDKYYTLLQERHELNVETKKLRKQNADLRKLLHHYISSKVQRNYLIPSHKMELPPPQKGFQPRRMRARNLSAKVAKFPAPKAGKINKKPSISPQRKSTILET